MADAKDSKKGSKKPSDSGTMWSNFMKEIDKTLHDIQAQKTGIQATDTKDLGSFIRSEATLSSTAIEFGGPLPHPKKPNWKEILSTDTKKPGQFWKTVYHTISESTADDEEQKIKDKGLMKTIHDAFQMNYDAMKNEKDQLVGAETFIDWITVSIISLEHDLDPDLQKNIARNLNGLVFGAGDLTKSPWTLFESGENTPDADEGGEDPDDSTKKSSKKSKKTDAASDYAATLCADSKSPGIWPDKFCPAIAGILNDAAAEDAKLEDEATKIVKRLANTLKGYDPNNEESVRSWIQTTVTGMPKTLLLNSMKGEVIANLEFEVTRIFPQPDKSYFYTNFQTLLYENIYNPPPMDATTAKLMADMEKQKALIAQAGDQLKQDELQVGGAKTAKKDDGGKTDDAKTPASPASPATDADKTTRPDLTDIHGIKQVLDDWFKNNDPSVSGQAKRELERSLRKAIKNRINDSFNNLVEQGTQGELISATYDRQMVSRIVDYTTNLLEELNNDLDNDIPTNSSASLGAAQDITSTAVAFRQFADSLMALKTAFDGEGDRQSGNTGANFMSVKKLIDGPHNNNPALGNMEDLAQAIYLGTGKPEPRVKSAEYYGVQLAATTAGLQTSLRRLLLGEQKGALSALNNLKENATNDFLSKYNSFKSDADDYFSDLDQYISERQDFEIDQFNRNVVQEAMNDLTNLIVRGE